MMSNFSGAVNSQDNNMAKDILLSEIHSVLDKNPEVLIEALNNSGIATSSTISKRDLIHKVVEALYESEKFRDNISQFVIGKASIILMPIWDIVTKYMIMNTLPLSIYTSMNTFLNLKL